MNYPSYPYYQYPTYQQQYQQPIVPQQIPQSVSQTVSQTPVQTTPNQILAWVKDEKEAMDFPLSAGQSIFLMTQDESYLYGKSCDQLGKTTFIKKKLVDESNKPESKVDMSEYIRREEIENLITDRIQREVEKRVSEISFKPTKTRKQLVEED